MTKKLREVRCNNLFWSGQFLICWTLSGMMQWLRLEQETDGNRSVVVCQSSRTQTPYSIFPPSRGLFDSSQPDFKASGAAGRESQRPTPFIWLCHTYKLWFNPFLLLLFSLLWGSIDLLDPFISPADHLWCLLQTFESYWHMGWTVTLQETPELFMFNGYLVEWHERKSASWADYPTVGFDNDKH